MADESTGHAGVADAQHREEHKFQDEHNEGQNHAMPEQDACDAQQIGAMTTFQAAQREAGSPAGFPPLNDDESAALAADTTSAHDDDSNDESTEEHGLDATETENTAAAHEAADEDSQHELPDEYEDEGPFYLDPVQVEATRRFIETLHDLHGLDGYADYDVFEVAAAATRRRNLLVHLDERPSYRNGVFGAVPASDAAVAGLEKRTFHAGCSSDIGGCAICLEDEFEEGQEVSVMPCSKAHAFHTQCINVWLGQSNTCPLCRHPLPPVSEDE